MEAESSFFHGGERSAGSECAGPTAASANKKGGPACPAEASAKARRSASTIFWP